MNSGRFRRALVLWPASSRFVGGKKIGRSPSARRSAFPVRAISRSKSRLKTFMLTPFSVGRPSTANEKLSTPDLAFRAFLPEARRKKNVIFSGWSRQGAAEFSPPNFGQGESQSFVFRGVPEAYFRLPDTAGTVGRGDPFTLSFTEHQG